ncbi:MAG: hypothetical protein KF710_00040 [Rhodocyclaceae bacterium]|nr:hypothetical protein [Rhodocyclaceae bacterium]MCP5308507.1 hypothetical protein [Zoogloeaceae bacterium]
MALDDLLAKLERGGVTAVTAEKTAAVTANHAPALAVTAVTAATAEKDKGRGDTVEMPPSEPAASTRATRWPLHFADGDPLEVLFALPVDHVEALAAEADAIAHKPVVEVRKALVRSEVRREFPARCCWACRHCKRPGLSAGYCGGRDDLPPAYGLYHPLRKLPADQGTSCGSYQAHED